MLHQDLILDLISRAADLLAQLLHGTTPARDETLAAAEPTLDAAAREWCGLSLDLAMRLEEGSLRAVLGGDARGALRTAILGMLLSAWGELRLRRCRETGTSSAAALAAVCRGLALMQDAEARLPDVPPGLQATLHAARRAL